MSSRGSISNPRADRAPSLLLLPARQSTAPACPEHLLQSTGNIS